MNQFIIKMTIISHTARTVRPYQTMSDPARTMQTLPQPPKSLPEPGLYQTLKTFCSICHHIRHYNVTLNPIHPTLLIPLRPLTDHLRPRRPYGLCKSSQTLHDPTIISGPHQYPPRSSQTIWFICHLLRHNKTSQTLSDPLNSSEYYPYTAVLINYRVTVMPLQFQVYLLQQQLELNTLAVLQTNPQTSLPWQFYSDFFSLGQKIASFDKPTVKLHFMEVSQS